MEIEINNTSATNDDLVALKCDYPSRRFEVSCRIRTTGSPSGSTTVVLTNPDGRLRFPGASDTTKRVSVPASGGWVSFRISGESASAALNDAVIEAHCNTASGASLATKTVTVFWFDQARIRCVAGGAYAITGGQYTVTGSNAVDYQASARIRPAGVNCTAPQVTDLRVGIMQDIDAYSQAVTWDNPTIAWAGAAASGTSVTVGTTMRLTTTFGAGVSYPVADTEASVSPLYDQPGKTGTLDANSLKKPIGCQTGGATAAATSFDTPSHSAPATLSLPVRQGGVNVGTVTWNNRVNTTRGEDFHTYCVIFNTSNNRFCSIREGGWSIHIDSAGAGAQQATGNADGPPSRTPATGVAANNAPHSQTTAAVGAATTTFTKP